MATDFHLRVRELIEAALQQDTKARDTFIREAAGTDGPLAAAVRSLLPHYLEAPHLSGGQKRRPGWRLPGPTTIARALNADDDSVEWAPPFSIAPYTVVEVLGRGGMGVVYRGIDPIQRREVAIKVLRLRLLTRRDRIRFKREEELLRLLRHPGIVRLLYGGVARVIRPSSEGTAPIDRRPYLVMEYVKGLPLTHYARRAQFDPLERLALLVPVCEAVEYAHKRGVVHRDLKPENILVDEAGQPHVLDFGIARIPFTEAIGPAHPAPHFTGTPAYASPEQLAGQTADPTPASDVYSLAIIAHELLTGQLPRRTSSGVALQVTTLLSVNDLRALADPLGFRYAAQAVLATALRKTRGKPYASAGEFGRDIAEICRIHSPPQSRLHLRRRLAEFFQGSSPIAGADQRLLALLLRRRIGLAMDRDLDVETLPAVDIRPPS
jgi:eukaryotic-like serine/threonine-protein kinase